MCIVMCAPEWWWMEKFRVSLGALFFNGQTSQIFNSPLYVDVIKNEIANLKIVIKNREGKLALFLTNPLSLTLHFKAYPFSI